MIVSNFMKFLISAFFLLVLLGCIAESRLKPVRLQPSIDKHMHDLAQLTFEGDNGEAYFSSDGKRLIYQSNQGGYACDKIWKMNIDGSGKRRVSPDRGAHTCAFFFPGNEQIIFASTSHLSVACPPKPKMLSRFRYAWPLYPYDIFKANADGSSLEKLTDNPKYDAEPVISSDGETIVFGSQRYGDFDIYIMDATGANVRRLTEKTGYDGGPWFSPDGKKIVWRAWYPESEQEKAQWADSMENNYIVSVPLDIWVMDVDGSNKQRLTQNGATNWAPSWHPDGKRIVFSSNMDDWHDNLQQYGHNFELYLINSDGSGLERITFNKVFDSFPMFSPDGKKLVFGANRNPEKPRATDIFIAKWQE